MTVIDGIDGGDGRAGRGHATGMAHDAGRRRGVPARVLGAGMILALAAGLLPAGASPVAAESVARTWTARSGSVVRASLVASTSGTGRLTIALAGAGANRAWTPRLFTGTCTRPGVRIVTLGDITTDATGAGRASAFVSAPRVSLAWGSTRQHGTFSLRLTSGTSTRCAPFWFERATRVTVGGLGIDLPVVPGGSSVLCDVAMYLTAARQPQEPGVTFLYAHARTSMFLPLLAASRVSNGASLIGRTVYVYTSADRRFRYRITQVRRGQTSIQRALDIRTRQLWLQTSEGPSATSTKLVVIAVPVGGPVAVSTAEARPTPRPRACR
jgi:Sortase domain